MSPKRRGMLLPGTIGLLIVAATLLGQNPKFVDPMIIVAEVFLAFAIALLLFSYSQETDRTLKHHLRYRRLVQERNKRLMGARKARANAALYTLINSLVIDCVILAAMGGKPAVVLKTKWPQLRDNPEALHRNVTSSAAELKQLLKDADHLDDRTCDDILAALGLLEDAPSIHDDKMTVDTTQYRAIAKSLCLVLDRLERRLDLAMSRPSRRPGPAGEAGGLALSLDRDTYPPGAAIRATVEADKQFPRITVTVTIHGEGPDALAKETVDAPVHEDDRNASVAIDVIPKKRLVVGQEYIARAACGDLYNEVAFAVEYTAPTVWADRRTCAIGDDIVVTVVDPDAAAGYAEKGPARAAKRQNLVVESSCGNIDASSRLRKEDHPAGTFRARVRCADANAVDAGDDAIPCEPDQSIHIRYESAAGEAWTAVLVEGPATATDSGPSPAAGDVGSNGGPDLPPGGGKGGDELHDAGPGPRGREGDEGWVR